MATIKTIARILLFIAILAGLLFFMSWLFVPKNNTAEAGMEEERANGILGEAENTIDVLILGDSEAYSSLIPVQLWNDTGYTSYNCGTSSQTLAYADVMLKRCFEKQSPKIVMLETHSIYRSQTNDEIIMERLCELLPLFRYHKRWKTMQIDDLLRKEDYSWTADKKGYWYSTEINPSNNTNYFKPTDKTAEISQVNKSSVKRIKRFCDDNGAKLVLFSTPSTENWNYERHNGIKSFAAELGCDYIDMNNMTKEIPIEWNKDTRDRGDHLNYFGAKKVSDYVSKYLTETGLLKSHKDDPDYAKWDEIANKFRSILPKQ